ncbi:hypothetical protein AB0L80_10685 [Streptomyces sp. NPDC052069]|uniref:hypothetical protein n=1 Tax=Streptomyces sp. NPDC052069 TaxID=3154650 RepID=UPI0034141429
MASHGRFRWFGGGRKANSEPPGPDGFASAVQVVRPEDVVESIPSGDDVGAVVEVVQAYTEAGSTEIALVLIGGDHQEPYLEWAQRELVPALPDI